MPTSARGPAAAAPSNTQAATAANVETNTVYQPSGKKRGCHAPVSTARCLVPDTQPAADAIYQYAPWEKAGKRMTATQNRPSAGNTLACPQQRPVTPSRVPVKPPPFGTSSMDPTTITAPRFQKRHVDTPMASESAGEADYLRKRSRTPPATVRDHCSKEGFCVLYSSRPTEGGDVQFMSMVERTGQGKSHQHGEKDFMQSRKESDAKASRIATHKRQLQAGRLAVDRPPTRPEGIRRTHTPTGTFRLSAPFAVNLPAPKIDDVGVSAVRARRNYERTAPGPRSS